MLLVQSLTWHFQRGVDLSYGAPVRPCLSPQPSTLPRKILENATESTTNGPTLTYTLTGRLELDLNGTLDGVTELVFDLNDLDYLSSAGLRVLLTAQKRMNTQGAMRVRNVNETIREIFDVTGFSDILTIE